MEIIGEAAGQVSEAFRQSHPGIDWRGMKDLRNMLIHGYTNVDPDEVWHIAHTHVPEIDHQLEAATRIRRGMGMTGQCKGMYTKLQESVDMIS